MIPKIWKAAGIQMSQGRKDGMSFDGLEKAMTVFKIRYHSPPVYKPSINKVDVNLCAGKAMILATYYNTGFNGHYVFCLPARSRYLVVNDETPVKVCNRGTMKKMLHSKAKYRDPLPKGEHRVSARCWFISK
jgi:hypothetical protein